MSDMADIATVVNKDTVQSNQSTELSYMVLALIEIADYVPRIIELVRSVTARYVYCGPEVTQPIAVT